MIAGGLEVKNHIFYFKIQIYWILISEMLGNCHLGGEEVSGYIALTNNIPAYKASIIQSSTDFS